jgi:hypothetical protein
VVSSPANSAPSSEPRLPLPMPLLLLLLPMPMRLPLQPLPP